MGTNADSVGVQEKASDSLHKDGKPQKATTKDPGCSQTAICTFNYRVEWKEKVYLSNHTQATRITKEDFEAKCIFGFRWDSQNVYCSLTIE